MKLMLLATRFVEIYSVNVVEKKSGTKSQIKPFYIGTKVATTVSLLQRLDLSQLDLKFLQKSMNHEI